MIDAPLAEAASACLAALRARGRTIATAESCTGGLVAAALTSIAGSSDAVHGGFVTYANEAKTAMLGVDAALIARVGAVSAEVAAAMAEGARARTGVAVAVSITGIAGPGGGSASKPVGTVWFGLASTAGVHVETMLFAGDREAVRHGAALHALRLAMRD
jgi:nicotinamide-nucleotide amidase